MAFFNPNKIDFNYNSGYIEPVGAVGKSLWDIYKNESLASFNRAKLNETKRANEASEILGASKLALDEAQHNQTFAETARHNRVSENIQNQILNYKTNADKRDYEYKQEKDNQDYNIKLAMLNATNELSRLKQEQTLNEIRAKNENDRLENTAYYNVAMQNQDILSQLGINPQSLINADDNTKNLIGAMAKKQINATAIKDKALKLSGLADRNKLRQDYVDDMARIKAGLDNLESARGMYNDRHTGWLDTVIHSGAKYINADDKKMSEFQSKIANALLQAKSLSGSSKPSNLQYTQFLESFPTGKEISDSEFISKFDASLDSMYSYLNNNLDLMAKSGVDVADLKEDLKSVANRILAMKFNGNTKSKYIPYNSNLGIQNNTNKPTNEQIKAGFKMF